MCKYINVKTVGCRNTIENKVCSALLTTTSLSYCLYFSDSTLNALYHPHMSVTYLSHPCFYQKLFLFLSAPAKIFVIVGTDLLFPFILHRSVCKGKACFTLTTWLGHQWVWAPFWLLSGYVFFNIYKHQCVRIGPSMTNCRQGQATDFLLLCYEYLWCEIYHLAMVYIDIWSLNHQYLCNFYVLIFKKLKDQWIKYSLNSVIVLCSN